MQAILSQFEVLGERGKKVHHVHFLRQSLAKFAASAQEVRASKENQIMEEMKHSFIQERNIVSPIPLVSPTNRYRKNR